MKIKYKKQLYMLIVALGFSGITLFILKNYFAIQTDYGDRPNPINDELKLFHIFFGFCYIFLIGVLTPGHIMKGLKSKSRNLKNSGILILSLSLISIISSCFLFYIVDEMIAYWVEWIHFGAGTFLILMLLIHIFYLTKAIKSGRS